jgi:superfamily II DNA helicase RecQ
VEASLDAEMIHHRFDIIREVFDFAGMVKSLRWFAKSCAGSIDTLYPTDYAKLGEIVKEFEAHKIVGENFSKQLTNIELARMTDDTYLNERLTKAAEYFTPAVERAFAHCCKVYDLEIDNKKLKKRIKEAGDEVITALDIVLRSLQAILAGDFSVQRYGEIKTSCVLEQRSIKRRTKSSKIVKSESAVEVNMEVNEDLRIELQEWRTERYKADNLPAYTIMHQSTLLEIAALVPKTREALLAIKGFGKAKFDKYGAEILEITAKY